MLRDTELSDDNKANIHQSFKSAKESYLSEIGETVERLNGVYSTHIQYTSDGPMLRVIVDDDSEREMIENVLNDSMLELSKKSKYNSGNNYTWYYYK